MSRMSTVVWMVVVVMATLLLYMVKYRVEGIQMEIAKSERMLMEELDALHVAEAEWAYLNRPERVQYLVSKYLSLTAMKGDQIADLDMLPFPSQNLAENQAQDEELRAAMSTPAASTGNIVPISMTHVKQERAHGR